MNKPQSLRRALNNAVPYVRDNPDKLHLFIDNGSVVATGGSVTFMGISLYPECGDCGFQRRSGVIDGAGGGMVNGKSAGCYS